jgi:hypothetical protein
VTVERRVGHQVLARLEHDLTLSLGAQRRLDGPQDVRPGERQLRDVFGRDEADFYGVVGYPHST